MRKVVYGTQFRKDYKRYVHKPKLLAALNEIVKMLERGENIPRQYKPHKLHGNYEGCMECHVQSDYLLIWIDENTGMVYLERLGTHSELF